jgi:hypothetical protein
MLRPLFHTTAFFAFFLLLVPGVPQAQSPPGLVYDEIARVVPSDATPPPPDAFALDFATLQASPPAPPPAAQRRGIFGGGSREESVNRDGGLGRFATVLAPFAPGRLERHAFLNGWERIDDPVARTATIYRCDVNQVIYLDLERKRYRIAVPLADDPAPKGGGTASGVVYHDGVALGDQSIAGMKTHGFAAIDRIVLTGSTGTCAGGTLTAATQTDYARIAEPHRLCPARRPSVPPAPVSWIARNGCTPSIKARNSGPVEPVAQLAVFRLQRIGSALAGTIAPIGFSVERGNVQTLDSNAQFLFAVPAGFRIDG